MAGPAARTRSSMTPGRSRRSRRAWCTGVGEEQGPSRGAESSDAERQRGGFQARRGGVSRVTVASRSVATVRRGCRVRERTQNPRAPQTRGRYPEETSKPAPLSDAELASLCFPHGVVPEKLRRSPSCSALDEVVLGRHVDSAEQCFVFRLKVGTWVVCVMCVCMCVFVCTEVVLGAAWTAGSSASRSGSRWGPRGVWVGAREVSGLRAGVARAAGPRVACLVSAAARWAEPQARPRARRHGPRAAHHSPHSNPPQVADNFPLYGVCWYVREMLHRPPSLARSRYRSSRAPFRSCMISAPRCYCLLSHYPFFDLHFRVRAGACGWWVRVGVCVWGV